MDFSKLITSLIRKIIAIATKLNYIEEIFLYIIIFEIKATPNNVPLFNKKCIYDC
jgi:hypothetical protein